MAAKCLQLLTSHLLLHVNIAHQTHTYGALLSLTRRQRQQLMSNEAHSLSMLSYNKEKVEARRKLSSFDFMRRQQNLSVAVKACNKI